ncbi:MAG: phosphohydrolase, partial [Desulfuromonadales bacterium]|nr:phosphohydrolase [Desulfuromonadales bacterium]
MTKNERKSDAVSTQKPLSRVAKQDQRENDERFQRTLLLLALVALLTFIIVPKGVLTPTEFGPGDIAPRDIKAPHDLLIPDDDLSQQKRVEAEKAVAHLYDFDPATGTAVTGQVVQVISSLHRDQEQEVAVEQQLAELEANFGIKPSNKTLAALKELLTLEDIYPRIAQVILPLYQQKVAGNLKLFEADRSRGVIFRGPNDQPEFVDQGVEKIIGLGELQDSLKKALGTTEFTNKQQVALRELIVPLLRPNISFNQNETEARRALAREDVKPVLIQVKKGEMIVREGDRITPDQLKRLGALQDENSAGTLWRKASGILLSCFILIYFVHTFARRNIRKYQPENRDLLFLATIFVVQILALKVSIFIATALGSAFPYVEQNAYYYLFPFAVGTMLVRVVLNSEVSLVFAILSSILTAVLFGNSFAVLIFAFLTSLSGAHWV